MKTKHLTCNYCGDKLDYETLVNDLMNDIWTETHQSCKDFLYIKGINVTKNKGVTNYESK